MTHYDHKRRIEADRACDVPGAPAVCVCPTCGVAEALLLSSLRYQNVTPEDTDRVRVVGFDFRGASHPYLASVRVDGREVYRIMQRVQEVLEPDVQDDVIAALRREHR